MPIIGAPQYRTRSLVISIVLLMLLIGGLVGGIIDLQRPGGGVGAVVGFSLAALTANLLGYALLRTHRPQWTALIAVCRWASIPLGIIFILSLLKLLSFFP